MKARVKKVVNCGHVRWVADLRCFDAGRKYFETEEEARTHWEAQAKEARDLGVGALSLSLEDRVQLMVAQDKLKPVGASLIEAVEFFLKFKVSLQKRTVREAYNEFIVSKQASGKRSRYIKALGYSVGKFVNVFDKEECAGITGQAVERWLFRHKLNPVTLRGYQIDLQTFADRLQGCTIKTGDLLDPIPRFTLLLSAGWCRNTRSSRNAHGTQFFKSALNSAECWRSLDRWPTTQR